MRKTTNLDDISIFVAAAEAGTFSAAAAHLQLPASTISRSLSRLEKHLDLLLVRRSQRGLSLTDAGKEYLLSCKRALRALREGRELLDKHRASPSGLLRVACPMTMARDAIAPLLSEFIETFPISEWSSKPIHPASTRKQRKISTFFSRFVRLKTRPGVSGLIPVLFADFLRALDIYKLAGFLPNQKTLSRIAALVRAGGHFQKEGELLRPMLRSMF